MNYNKLKSYGVFALVLLFLVWQTVDFFRVNFWLLSGRPLGRFDTISSVLYYSPDCKSIRQVASDFFQGLL